MQRRSADPRSSDAPERVGRYELLLPIASGGMATVYLARSRGLAGFERDVALKLMHAHLRESEEFSSDLIEEAKLGVRIRHANVASVLDVGDDPRGVFLVMEYVEGETLAGLIKLGVSTDRPLPIPIGMKILLDALAGLHAAHELCDERGAPIGVVHRDFSPQNLLVGLDGVARLADFGVAKAATRLGHTRTGLVKGKIAYMAPEQARDLPLDRRCDVWAAGVVAWELLAGRRLHRGGNDPAILLALVSEAPPRLKTIRADIPAALEEAVARALTLDPDARWPTADAFSSALIAGMEGYLPRAETAEVAAYIRSVAGARVADRSARAAEIVRLRAEAASLAAGAPEVDASTSAAVVAEVEPTDTTSVSGAPPAVARATPRLPKLFAVWAAAGLLGAAAAAWMVTRASPEPPPPSLAATPAVSGAAEPLPQAAVPEVDVPRSAAPAPGEAVELVVRASAPLASLQLGDRVLPIPRPTTTVTLPLAAADRSGPISLAARAVDGRSVIVTLAPGATTVDLVFPAPGRPRSKAATTADPKTPLAKSPYEGPP